ncbi:uncharacterized protein K460DRAFT_404480 [Cucurbitaria berberidis CBS 394.84]|uniref:Uncharacterized protein n=1 Tax=Cucurbitaria berberidis CBS 394.84 TaxID=1168544 RepID=A0A9P4LBN9_9PLEO|nr:uncharacterized protein K460DRAFT_404480 [Cucurbitaria berberidis CBS 394.84]KAF1849245.1 hypothetical protein K460DRAFT_404480 [Cucurbitaria berberidis CBS 394.84]
MLSRQNAQTVDKSIDIEVGAQRTIVKDSVMSPKAKDGKPRYKELRDFFKTAYRIMNTKYRVSAHFPQRRSRVLLLGFGSMLQTRRNRESVDLRETRSQQLFTIDDATIPDEPKTTSDPAPSKPASTEDEDGVRDVRADDESETPRASSKTHVNTTPFPHLSDMRALNDPLPNIEYSDPGDTAKERNGRKRRWHDAGLRYPEK